MSVVNVTRSWSGQQAGDGRQGASVTEVYSVLLDAPSKTGHLQAKNAGGVPRLGQRHPNLAGLYVTDRNATPEGPSLYEVAVTYGPREDAAGGAAGEDLTINEAQVQWGWEESTEAVDADFKGLPILNSAGEPFDPPLSKTVRDRVCTIRRYEADTKARRDLLNAYDDVVNSDAIYGYAPGRGRLRNGFRRLRSGGARALDVTYEIVFRAKPPWMPDANVWDRRLLDQGYRTLGPVGADGLKTLIPIAGPDGTPVSQPARLNGAGGRLADGAKPVWLLYRFHEWRRFAELNLPPED